MSEAPKPDTSAAAVKRLALLAASRAVLGRAAALSGDEDEDRRDKLNRVAREHAETAATLRALLAERDAAWQDGWAAGRDAAAREVSSRMISRDPIVRQMIRDGVAGLRALPVPPPPSRDEGTG